MKSIKKNPLLPSLLRTNDSKQVVSVCCFRICCWYDCRCLLVDILTVRALIMDLNLLLICF
ncbi:hypothetical protein BDZ91DRAFT_718855 [Kalaharituber pfeilii]|nr:hypothetical protein BDZ91DRAFT_718855 [Kalaharituber pfeilii]